MRKIRLLHPQNFDRIWIGKDQYRLPLACGMARNHRGNPAASLRVESSYSAPKLFSGLASLFLSPADMEVLTVHRRLTLQRLQRLHPRTPAPALHFLSGSLPAPALLHKHQYTLLHMIALLGPSNILYQHAIYALHHCIRTLGSRRCAPLVSSTPSQTPSRLFLLQKPSSSSNLKSRCQFVDTGAPL